MCNNYILAVSRRAVLATLVGALTLSCRAWVPCAAATPSAPPKAPAHTPPALGPKRAVMASAAAPAPPGPPRPPGTVRLMLTGDVMLGRGVDQILPQHVGPRIYESYIQDARDYGVLAVQVGGAAGAACGGRSCLFFLWCACRRPPAERLARLRGLGCGRGWQDCGAVPA